MNIPFQLFFVTSNKIYIFFNAKISRFGTTAYFTSHSPTQKISPLDLCESISRTNQTEWIRFTVRGIIYTS